MRRPKFESRSGIYLIRNTENGNIYVGSSRNLPSRFSAHRRALETGRHEGIGLQAAWNKYGSESFEFIVAEYCDVDDLIPTEQMYIDILKPRYNRNPVAGKPPVTEYTDERRAQVSAQFKGRRHTDETKRKMSEAAKGRVFSEEHRRNIAIANRKKAEARRGTRDTDDARRKKSEAMKKRLESDPGMSWMAEARHKRAKLSDAQAVEVRAMCRSGITQKKVAEHFNVGYWVINAIMSGKSFAHVPDLMIDQTIGSNENELQ
jgi:group I intron endonuclease